VFKYLSRYFNSLFFPFSDIGEETKKEAKMKIDIDQFIRESLLNSESSVIFDVELFPFIQDANNGDIDAIMKVAYAFMSGENAKANYDIAIRYFDLLFKSLDESYYMERHQIQFNIAIIEAKKGNYEELKLRFYNIIKQLYKEVPIEEWNFDVFDWMKECINSQEQ